MSAPAAAPERGQFSRLLILIATSFVDMVGFSIVFPLLPFYALKLHGTALDVGLITGAFSAAQILSAPIWGRVSDRYGRRPALLIGLLSSAAAYVVFGLASTIWLLILSRLIQGAGGGTTGVAQAYVADTVRPGDRARALGWLSAATSAGVMLGPAIGSFATRINHQMPGFVAAALCLINAAFAWKWLPESRRGSGASVRPRKPVWDAAWQVFRNARGAVPRLIWVYAGGMLAFSALSSVLALYLGATFGITEQTIAPVFIYVAGVGLVMRSILLGPIVDRIGETWTMRTGALVLVVGLLLYPHAHSLMALAFVIPFVPIGTALLFPATTALISRQTDPAELGTVMGVAQTFAGISRVVAPLFATAVFAGLGHVAPFYVSGAIVAVVALLAFQIQPPASVPTPAAGTPAGSPAP
ncbi:MAG: MFS transporter [Gemmatimonadales bacterium]|nr:MFS transporter [Gemmatimonadales bacterium]